MTTTTLPPTDSSSGAVIGSNGGSSSNYLGSSDTIAPTAPTTPSTSTTVRGHTTTTTPVTAKPKSTQLVALRLPDAGDRLVLPIVLGLGLLAVIASGTQEVRRNGRKLLRRARRNAGEPGGQTAP